MTATLAQSAAILKTRYEGGKLPKSNYQEFPHTASITKREDFDGANKVIALQTENPQGAAPDFATALGSIQQGNYQKFTIERVEAFGVARVKGQALKAAQGNAGAFVDLWRNETDGISQTVLKSMEWHLCRDGSGVIGAFTVSGTTNTMSTTEDIAGVDMGMRVQTGDATTPLTPTMRNGSSTGWVVEVDRKAGTFKVSATSTGSATAIGTVIPGTVSADSLYRAGEAAVAGTATVMTGERLWVVGGTSPGTLWGLNRNPDPVRRSGQEHDATGQAMEDAIIDAESLLTFQGIAGTRRLRANSRDIRKWKKSLGGKFTYPRGELKTKVGVSFRTVEFEGENGVIQIVSTPFQPSGKPILIDPEFQSLDTLGPAPQMLDWDGSNFLRVASDDAYEVRFGWYGNLNMGRAPSKHVRLTGWGL